MAEKIKIPDYVITWNGKSADDLKGEVSRIIFEDYEHGQSDNIEITFQDVKKIWQGDWFPVLGDIIKLKIGYKDEPLLDCGTFELDEIVIDMPPDHLTVKARSAFASKKLKQANSVSYETTGLREIGATIAGEHGMKFEFDGKDVAFKAITQYRESDLAFLKRLAERCGFILKITDEKLVLYGRETIEGKGETAKLTRAEIRRLSLRQTSVGAIKTARSVAYHHQKNKTFESEEQSKAKTINKDELRIYERLEDSAQAKRYAEAATWYADRKRFIDSITTLGNQAMVAGINVLVEGYKQFDGLYFVEMARHDMTGRERYETDLLVKRVKV